MGEIMRELIARRRRQILVHSCLYYQYNESIVSDTQYDTWARELAQLQADYPVEAAAAVYAKDFADFAKESVTGFDLPFANPEIVRTAAQLLRIHKKRRQGV
jgi:NAD-dependent DNA ligase